MILCLKHIFQHDVSVRNISVFIHSGDEAISQSTENKSPTSMLTDRLFKSFIKQICQIIIVNWLSLGFGLLVGQNKTFKDVTLSFLMIFWHFIDKKIRFINPSIHSLPLIQGQVTVAAGWVKCSRRPSPQQSFPAPLGGSRGVLRPDEMWNPSSVCWVYPGVSYQLDMQKASKGRRPEGILIRCPNHLDWLLSTRRSSGSSPSSLWCLSSSPYV